VALVILLRLGVFRDEGLIRQVHCDGLIVGIGQYVGDVLSFELAVEFDLSEVYVVTLADEDVGLGPFNVVSGDEGFAPGVFACCGPGIHLCIVYNPARLRIEGQYDNSAVKIG